MQNQPKHSSSFGLVETRIFFFLFLRVSLIFAISYDVSCCRPLWVNLFWNSLCFLDVIFFSFTRFSQFSSVTQSCPTLCDLMDCSMPGFPVHHQLPELAITHVHQVSDAIQPSHPLSSPSPPVLNPSQHQGLFKWVSSLHQVAKVLELQLQNQSYQWTCMDVRVGL